MLKTQTRLTSGRWSFLLLAALCFPGIAEFAVGQGPTDGSSKRAFRAQDPRILADVSSSGMYRSARLAGADLLHSETSEDDPYLFAGPGEIRLLPLAVGHVDGSVSVVGTLRPLSAARPLIALFSDAERSRGNLLRFDPETRRVTVTRIGSTNETEIASAAFAPSAEGELHIALSVEEGRLQLLVGDQPCFPRRIALHGSRRGQLAFGVEDGGVQLRGVSVEARLTSESRQRLRARSRSEPLPTRPSCGRPLRSLLPIVPPEDLVLPLAESDRAVFVDLWKKVANGAVAGADVGARELVRKAPFPGPRTLRAAVLLMEGGDAHLAREVLRGLEESVPEGATLMADAHWILGDRAGVFTALEKFRDPHDPVGARALLAISHGFDPPGDAALAAARHGSCRRCVDRAVFATDLQQFFTWKGFHEASDDRVRSLSDFNEGTARRHRAFAQRVLTELDALFPGGCPHPRRVTVATFDSRARYDAWNERLGGVRHADTEGVYRPGPGLVMVLDDEDEEVVQRRVAHELVHHAVSERGYDLPVGFEEGLACALAGPARDRRGVDAPRYREAQRALADGVNPSYVLLKGPTTGTTLLPSDYGVAWAAVHALHARPGNGLADLIEQLSAPANTVDERRRGWRGHLEAAMKSVDVRKHLATLR